MERLTLESISQAADGTRVDDLVFFPRPELAERLQASIVNDAFMMVARLPYAHHGFAVLEPGLVGEAWSVFDLARLHEVRQLAYPPNPFLTGADVGLDGGAFFQHTRALHSLDVMSVLTLILRNSARWFYDRSNYHLARVAALSHDKLTPAGGDMTKRIDRKGLDEDGNFFRLFADPKDHAAQASRSRRDFCAGLGFDWRQLDETVRGEGLFGLLLDMADKIAYVGRDAHELVRWCTNHPRHRCPGYPAVAELLLKDPWICSWWDSVHIGPDSAYIGDIDRLERFLELRVLLFRHLYHPDGRSLNFVLPVVILSYLYETGALTRDDLVRMGDGTLDHLIAQFCGLPRYSNVFAIMDGAQSECYRTLEEALRAERELVAEGTVFTDIDDLSVFKTAAYLPVRNKAGFSRPFGDVRPDAARRLHNLLNSDRPFKLHWFRESALPAGTRRDLLAFRRRQLRLD